MKFMGVNLWAVLVSGLATMVVGFVWYSPMLFARPWTILMGYDPDDKAKLAEMQKSAGPSYMLSLVCSFVSAAVLGKIIAVATINTPLYGMKVGLAVWLGFVTTVQLTSALFQPAAGQVVRDQYGLSVGVLLGDGSDHGSLAVEAAVGCRPSRDSFLSRSLPPPTCGANECCRFATQLYVALFKNHAAG